MTLRFACLCAVTLMLAGCPDNGTAADAATPRTDAFSAADAAEGSADAAMTAMDDAAMVAMDDAATMADAPPTPATWSEVHAQLRMHCALCHGGGVPATGGHNMAQTDAMAAFDDSQLPAGACAGLTKGACAAMRVRAGTMPPGGLAEPARSTVAAVLEGWVAAGQPAP